MPYFFISQIVGVAEPRQFYRERLIKEHNIPDGKVILAGT